MKKKKTSQSLTIMLQCMQRKKENRFETTSSDDSTTYRQISFHGGF